MLVTPSAMHRRRPDGGRRGWARTWVATRGQAQVLRRGRSALTQTSTLVRAHPRAGVLGAAVLLVVAQLGFRAWAVLPSFFYSDDYSLVAEARDAGFDLRSFLVPHGPHFMPFGRFAAWVASLPDAMSWPLMGSTALLLQAVAGVTCIWMLVTLFGARWQVLMLLALYLSSPMTMPATMWWSAAIEQVPLQTAFFVAVGCWVNHLRGRGWRWLALTGVVLAIGLLCYVKTLLVFPVLAFLALGWFASGGPWRRVVTVVRRSWPAVVVGTCGAVAFIRYYLDRAESVAAVPASIGGLANEMLGTTFPAGALGGPWRWDDRLVPVALADPPAWTVHLSWVLMVLVVAHLALRRDRTLRAWVLLGGYLTAEFALLVASRSQVVGDLIGREYRYLTDTACVVVLALGLAGLELRGAVESSAPRSEPLLTRGLGSRAAVVCVALVVVSGTFTSWSYARVWHTQHPGERFFGTALASAPLAQRSAGGTVDLANQFLTERITGAFGPPYSTSGYIIPLLDPRLRFPDHTDVLHVLDADGAIVEADVDPLRTTPAGPTPGCGYPLRGSGATIPLDNGVYESQWWLRIAYLSSQDTGLRVSAGRSEVSVDVSRGLGTAYVQVDGSFTSVSLSGIDPGVTFCLDRVDVGPAVAVKELR